MQHFTLLVNISQLHPEGAISSFGRLVLFFLGKLVYSGIGLRRTDT